MIVIITGGSDGLGKTIAKELAAKHTVIIASNTPDKLAATAQELGCESIVCDVTSWESVQKMVDHVEKTHGAIDCMIANAGIWIEGELETNDPALIEQALNVNTLGMIYSAKAVVPIMKKQGAGRIILTNSQGGFYGKAKRSIYTASKWAITGFAKSIEPELATYGIAVTDLHPGKLDTNLFVNAGVTGHDMSDALDPEAVARIVAMIVESDPKIAYPEIGIKRLGQ